MKGEERCIENKVSKLCCRLEFCKLCGICVKFCPTKNLCIGEKGLLLGDKCIGCGLCEMYCPEGAIFVEKK